MPTSVIVLGQSGLSLAEAQSRFIKRDADTFVASGITIYFMDAGSNLRIKNGKLQIRNDHDQSWFSLGCKNIDNNIPDFYVIEPGVS